MSAIKHRGVSTTQESGFVAALSWDEPIDAEEARLLLDLFEIALRPLRRLAELGAMSGDVKPIICTCGHLPEAHAPYRGGELACFHHMPDGGCCPCNQFEGVGTDVEPK